LKYQESVVSPMKVMVLPALIAVLTLFSAGCTTLPDTCIDGSGTIASESRDPGFFHSVNLALPATLTVREGDSAGVVVKADANVLPFITTTVKDGTLTISQNRPCVRPSTTIQVTADAPTAFRELAILGAGEIQSDGVLHSDRLALKITGAGSLDLAVEAVTLSTTVTGTGNVRLSGIAADHIISLPGAGSVDAPGLQTSRTSVNILGSGKALVDVSDSLTVKITGAGTVLYTGNPEVNQTITGAGSVRHRA
jgi:hypothetical protein